MSRIIFDKPLGKYYNQCMKTLCGHVNPFIGTGGIPWAGGMAFPGAAAPFGMARPGPDTCFPFGVEARKAGTSGYHYSKTHVRGFSHTRVSGAGLTEGGLFRVTPIVLRGGKRGPRPLRFSHKEESASPGYYAVWLPQAACLAEMTATQHCGVHRYTFQGAEDAGLHLDAGSFLGNGQAENVCIRVIDKCRMEGEARIFTGFSSRYGGLKAYFYAECDTPFNHAVQNDTTLALHFCNPGNIPLPITLRLGLSFLSREEARNNLQAECQAKGFDQIRAETQAAWEDRLSRIEIRAGGDIPRIFYTALYHCMPHPSNMTEASGRYLGFHSTTGAAEDFTYRSDLSLWDTFRTTHPLYCLVAPDIQRDSAQSLLRMARASGTFPRWPSGGGEGGSMFGNPAHIVMAESFHKGLIGREDATAALDFMKKAAFETREHADEYLRLGYIPSDARSGSVSWTLEYAWADYAAALLARALGREEDAARFTRMSQSFRNLWDPRVRYFRAKDSRGQWQAFHPRLNSCFEGFLAQRFSPGFTEGSARHYRWHAVQDPQGLIALMGGREAFAAELERYMQDASRRCAALHPGSGYWIGNEHNLHAAYLFNEAGRPDLTQKWARWTLAHRFADCPGGLDGNDDLGALSAWYVFSALGFYPIAGTGRYWLGAPIVDEAALRLAHGKSLVIKTQNQSAASIYVRQVTLNGNHLGGSTFTHDQIKDGGTLEFEMTSQL